jgi:hypothetical protein
MTIEKLQARWRTKRGVIRSAVVGVREMMAACNSAGEWCRGTELNCRHQPFQGCALPTELPRHYVVARVVGGIQCLQERLPKIKRELSESFEDMGNPAQFQASVSENVAVLACVGLNRRTRGKGSRGFGFECQSSKPMLMG